MRGEMGSQTLPANEGPFSKIRVIDTYISDCDYDSASDAVIRWAKEGGTATYTTCHVNSHGAVNGTHDPRHQHAMNEADLVTPDGWPVVKSMQKTGSKIGDRVTGPHLMEAICRKAAEQGVPIGLYGGKIETLDALQTSLESRYPGIQIPYKYSPPFRALTEEETLEEDRLQVASGARIYFIGLGCPKQEIYVQAKKQRGVPGVYMAVGAAIDINSGLQKKCPPILERTGFEWAFRLFQNPKRLWRRYAKYPFLFLLLDRKARTRPN